MMLKRIFTVAAVTSALLITTTANANTVSQKTWVMRYKTMFPSYLCEKYQEVPAIKKTLKHNRISYKRCTQLISRSLRSCLTQYKKELPTTLNIKTGKKWGRTIGTCTSNRFYAVNIKKKTKHG